MPVSITKKSLFSATLALCVVPVLLPIDTARSAPVSMKSKPVRSQRWWPETTQNVLTKAGANRVQLVKALYSVPVSQRDGLRFLIENMPDADLKSLSARFLLDHLALAYSGWAMAPWKQQIPKPIFLNDVLPYASLTETRDRSSLVLRDKARAIINGCRTPSEAAMKLNKELFPLVNVRYSTERKRPDQSAIESMASGKASCSGLAILLVEACRAVGIPARVVGTPMWSNGRGNHTWIEIWDGEWHFLGAAEPDEKGLNHGWFTGDAAQARKDIPRNAIYASSFKKTGLAFPLVWAPKTTWVNAVNVTERYAPNKVTIANNKTLVLFKVLDDKRQRVASKVTVLDAKGAVVFSGTSRSEANDLNDFLRVELQRGENYKLVVGEGATKPHQFQTQNKPEQTVVLQLVKSEWTAEKASLLKRSLIGYFTGNDAQKSNWTFTTESDNLLRDNEAKVRQIAWEAYREAAIHQDAKQDYDAKQVHFDKHLSPYLMKTVGTRPANGWGLVIAMHGGGGTAKEVNDSQWQGMFRHYKDHPERGGYHYLSLRAPNDTWNGFYDDYVYPLVVNLIRQFTLFGDVNPNKVFIMGYSHGGYGAYAIGPKMPDRFAAIHASAGAATDGETAAKNLRNTKFTAMVGEKDLAYDRLGRNQRFDAEIKLLRGGRTDIYPVRVDVMAGFEHGNLHDGDKLVEMLPATRNPVPRELTWQMTDGIITDFYWLLTQTPAKTREIEATCRDNQLTVVTKNLDSATVFLDERLVEFDKPIQVDFNDLKSEIRLRPSLRTLCETLAQRGDPDLAFTVQLELPVAKKL